MKVKGDKLNMVKEIEVILVELLINYRSIIQKGDALAGVDIHDEIDRWLKTIDLLRSLEKEQVSSVYPPERGVIS